MLNNNLKTKITKISNPLNELQFLFYEREKGFKNFLKFFVGLKFGSKLYLKKTFICLNDVTLLHSGLFYNYYYKEIDMSKQLKDIASFLYNKSILEYILANEIKRKSVHFRNYLNK